MSLRVVKTGYDGSDNSLNANSVAAFGNEGLKIAKFTGLPSPTGKYLKDNGTWDSPTASATWGGISGTLSSQTDLQSALDGKSNTHTHPYEPADSNIQTHITSTHAPSNAQANADITKEEIEAKLTGEISTHSHNYAGYALNVLCLNQATTTDGATVYWGSIAAAPSTTAAINRLYIPRNGTIKAAIIFTRSATAGTGENWSMYIRLDNSSDTLIQTVGAAAAVRVFSNTSLNISVTAGQYIEIKEVMPTWSTNPANVTRGGVIYIE